MRVCYFGTYRAQYARNQIMIAGLRAAGADVVECNEPLWDGIQDRIQVTRGGWAHPRFWRRVLSTYGRLLRRYRAVGDYDVLMVAYPGQFDVYLARALSWVQGKPLVWDILMSIYLVAVERGLEQDSRLTVGTLRLTEGLALRLPNRVIADTSDYVAWYARTHHTRPDKFRLVPIGADDSVFQFQPTAERQPGEPLRVVYYGTFIPNHGVAYILEAARQLADEPRIALELIGEGPDRPLAEALAARYQLTNVSFSPWLEQAALAAQVAQAEVVLGAFGLTPQSLMTVHNKIYEGLALARPVVTGDSPAVRAALVADEEVLLVDRHDPCSLAAILRTLLAEPALCARVAAAGHQRFIKDYTVAAIGRRTLDLLGALVSEAAKPYPGERL